MDPQVGASVAQGGSQFLGSIVDGIFNSVQAKKQREYGKEMAEYSYNKDVEFWNMQNEYNSPKAQMQRFQDAGLNPHLMYGQGTPGNAQGSVKYNTPNDEFYKSQKTQIPNMIAMYQDLIQRKGEIDRIKKMNDILDEKRDQEFLNTMNQGYEFGLNWGFSPLDRISWQKLPTQTGEYHRPMKLYQMDMAQQELAYKRGQTTLNATRNLSEGARKAVSDKMASWMDKKLQWWEDQRINIDRDTMTDRLMQEMMKNLPVGAGWLKTLIPLFSGIIRR